MVSLAAGLARGGAAAPARARRSCSAARLNRDELAAALREHAYLEGDFVLRSGRRSRTTSTSTASRRGPDLLGPLGEAIAAAVAEHEPEAVRLAAPELGAVALAAAASLASGLPFLIVRKEAKEYGTAQPPRRACSSRARCVCLVEDVVTSGGAARRGRRGAPRGRARVPNGRLRRRSRGGRSGRPRARGGAAAAALSSPPSSLRRQKVPQNRMVEPKAPAC